MRADQREQPPLQPVTQPQQALKVPAMIDHTGVNPSDFAQSKALYPEALTRKPECWGAFVLDPDDHNMKTVCQGPGRA